MKYFDLLDNIEQPDGKIKNLFQQIVLKGEIPIAYKENYVMQDGDSLESLAFRLYGNHELFWLLSILNGIQDLVYDLPLPIKVLQTISKKETKILLNRMATDPYIKQYLDQKLYNFRDTESFFAIINPMTDAQINAQAQAELTEAATFYNQIFLIMLQNLEYENDAKRQITIIKPPFIKKVIGQVYEAVKRDRN